METKIINGHTYTKAPGGWQLQQAQAESPQRSGAGEFLPTAFAVGGSVLGGIAGSVIPGAGTVAGGIGGATVGGAVGEAIQQKIEQSFGERENISPGQITGAGIVSGLTQVAGVGAAKILGVGVKATSHLVKPKMISFFKALSGHDEAVITKALTRTPGAVSGVKKGEVALRDVVTRSAQKLSQLGKNFVAESKNELSKIVKSKLSENSLYAKVLKSTGEKYKAGRTEIFNKFGDFYKGTVATLRENNIGVDKNGILNFVRPNQPSRIVSGSEQKAIQDAYNLSRTVRNNLSLKHVDSVLERLIVLKSKTPAGTPTGTETKAVIGTIIDNLMGFIKNVYPANYTQFLEKNLQNRVFLNQAKELLGDTAHLSPKEQALVMNRLLQLFNTGKLPIQEFVGKVGTAIGEDITGTTAGTLVKTGGQVSVRAPELTRRKLLEKAVEAIPRASLHAYIKTGKLTGDLLSNPAIVRASKALKISTKLVIQEIVNLSTGKTTR